MDLDNQNKLILIGDTHGFHSFLFDKFRKIKDALFIHVGDYGMGFSTKGDDEYIIDRFQRELAQNNNKIIVIRGNHDKPEYFSGQYKLENIWLAPDYTAITFKDKIIQLIGGGISVDRSARTVNVDYWENEGIEYSPRKVIKSDILITHTAPDYCKPVGFNGFVLGWARSDSSLLDALTLERKQMSELVALSECKHHIYGHFHASNNQIINGCRHICLNITEFKEIF